MWYETQSKKFDNFKYMHVCKWDSIYTVYVCECVRACCNIYFLVSFDGFVLLRLHIPSPSPQLPIHRYGLLPLLPNP